MAEKVFALFYGGSSYSWGTLEDIEEFDSIHEMRETLRDRRKGRDSSYPTVDTSACMYVWSEKPTMAEWDTPDRIYEIGPKGGIVRTF